MQRNWFGRLTIAALAALLSGCVSQAEFDRVEFARRTAETRAVARERELADERGQREVVESERNAARRQLDTTKALTENLKAENARLVDTLKKTVEYADTAMAKGFSDPGVIEVTKLPPELDRALKEFASRYPGTVEYLPDRGMVRWKSDLTFALGSDIVNEQAASALREFAEIVNRAGAQFELVIVGHTDAVPIRASNREHKTNWHLSCHRAIAVMNALRGAGVPNDRMGCMGYGEYRPREANGPNGQNEKNRRVEIFLVSSKESFANSSSANATDTPMPRTPTRSQPGRMPDGARRATDTPRGNAEPTDNTNEADQGTTPETP